MFSSYALIAHSTVAPTTTELNLVMSHAVVFGSLSILCTLIPVSLAVAGMMKSQYSTRLAG
jgi:heme/copper-type cytochrome/quinol oxidase subunit 4